MGVYDVALELTDADEDQQGQRRDVERLRQTDQDDDNGSDQRPDHRHDLDEADEAADKQPVVQPDQIEAEREHRADYEDHPELQARVGAESLVDREVRLASLVALRVRAERSEQLDHPVALRDPVPGRREREEHAHNRVGCLVAVSGDGMEQLRPVGKLVQLTVGPDEHVVAGCP
jgi:hypothetical protein